MPKHRLASYAPCICVSVGVSVGAEFCPTEGELYQDIKERLERTKLSIQGVFGGEGGI